MSDESYAIGTRLFPGILIDVLSHLLLVRCVPVKSRRLFRLRSRAKELLVEVSGVQALMLEG